MTSALTLHRVTGSHLERLDPRGKIIASVLLVLALIISDSVALKALVVLALLIAWLGARLGLRLLAVTVGSLAFFFLTTMTLRAVIRGQSSADARPLGPLRYSPSGVVDGVTMCLQILGVVLALSLLVRTTESIHLAEGMERLLTPFKRFGLPAHEAVMMFSIALRFLPIMVREVGRMQTAQLARSGGVHRRGVLSRAGAVLPLLIPVVVVSLVRARELAEAMEARGYRGDIDRTRVREYQFGSVDVLLIGCATGVLVGAILTRLW
jgi:energy-coupling factor transport system permease protein